MFTAKCWCGAEVEVDFQRGGPGALSPAAMDAHDRAMDRHERVAHWGPPETEDDR